MNGRGSGGMGGGRGRGAGMRRGQGGGAQGQGRGRMGGSLAVGPGGFCLCPNCGQKEPHHRGIPCVEQKCPQCGTLMIRE